MFIELPLTSEAFQTDVAPEHWREIEPAFDSHAAPHMANCVWGVRDQGSCGSCWSFAVSGALADRTCYANKPGPTAAWGLSPQQMVSCCPNCWADAREMGCGGGYEKNAWDFTGQVGLVSASCISYLSAQGQVPPCSRWAACDDGSQVHYWKSIPGTYVTLGNEMNIQQSILAYGSVSTCFMAYQDLLSYRSGIYSHTTGAAVGGHCVKITGWNTTTTGQGYWLVQNSWGTSWGINGWFFMAKGRNDCGIEAGAGAARV
jgi:cathepsin B